MYVLRLLRPPRLTRRLPLLVLAIWLLGTLAALATPIDPALHAAILAQDVAAVEAALDAGADPDGTWSVDETDPAAWALGNTPLTYSASLGLKEIINLLLHAKASPDQVASNQRTALHLAVANNHPEALHALLQGHADPLRGDGKSTPLSTAITEGHLELVKTLVRAGVSPDSKNADGSPMLMVAIEANQPAVAEYLLEAGADHTAMRDRDGKSIRDVAEVTMPDLLPKLEAEAQLPWTIISLIGIALLAGIAYYQIRMYEISKSGINSKTAKYWDAAVTGDVESLREALHAEQDPNETNLDGLTALHLAAEAGHARIVTSLLSFGAEVDGLTPEGRTAFYEAALEGHVDVLQALMEGGTDVEQTSPEGTPVIVVMALMGHAEVVGWLLDQGIDVDTPDSSGATPLRLAVDQSHAAAVRVLLEGGADPDKAGGVDALIALAGENDDGEIQEILESHGATPPAVDTG